MQLIWLTLFWYWPPEQSLHAPPFDASTNWPGMQSTQKPSADMPHPCRAPDGHMAQAVHDAAFVEFENVSAGQSAHLLSVPTNMPGAQSAQKPPNDFAQDWRSPAGHATQLTQLDCLEEF